MRAKIASGAVSALFLTAVTLVGSVIFVKLVVVYLPLDQAGFWFLLMSISQLILFFDLGFSPTLTRMIGLTLGRENEPETRNRTIQQLIGSLQSFTYAIAAVIFLVGVPFGIFLLPRLLSLSNFYSPAWVVFLLGAVTNLAGGVSLASLNGLGYVSTERLLRAMGQVLWLFASFTALQLGFDVLGLAIAWTLQGIVVRIAAGLTLRSRHPELFKTRQAPDFARVKEMFPPSIRWAITSLGAILILQSGNIVITKLMGTAAVPQYEAINRMLAALMTLGILCASASSPFISRAFGANDHDGVKRLLFLNVRIGMCIVLVAAVFLLLHGRAIVSLWLSPSLFAGEAVIYFGIAMAVLEVHHVILATAVMASGPVPFAAWAVGAGILNIAFGFMLVPKFGLAGMAASTFLAQLLTNNWYAPLVAFRRFRIPFLTYLRDALKRPIAVAIILWIIGSAMRYTFGAGDTALSLISQAAIYSAMGIVVGYLVLLDAGEKLAIRTFLNSRLRNV
jgi:O-antigen/teichoic acid export membrane protein